MRSTVWLWPRARGANAFLCHIDACFGVDREVAGGDESIIFGGAVRNGVSRSLVLEEDEDTLLFRVATGEDAANKILTDGERKIWDALKSFSRAFTWTEALEAAGGKNTKASLSRTIRKLQHHFVLAQRADKRYYRVSPGTSETSQRNQQDAVEPGLEPLWNHRDRFQLVPPWFQ